jgi:predicted DNA-binding protein
MPRPAGSKNKKPAEGRKTIYKTISISALPEEVEQLKALAQKSGKTLSRFLVELALQKEN